MRLVRDLFLDFLRFGGGGGICARHHLFNTHGDEEPKVWGGAGRETRSRKRRLNDSLKESLRNT